MTLVPPSPSPSVLFGAGAHGTGSVRAALKGFALFRVRFKLSALVEMVRTTFLFAVAADWFDLFCTKLPLFSIDPIVALLRF